VRQAMAQRQIMFVFLLRIESMRAYETKYHAQVLKEKV
jgi:hypothetical protein